MNAPAGTVGPLPDPPKLSELRSRSDLVLKARLLNTNVYKIGRRTKGQSRFQVLERLCVSALYPVEVGDRFSVTFRLNPGKWSGLFREPPAAGEYYLFLRLKNVEVDGKIVGYVTALVFPHPFAFLDPVTDLDQIQALRSSFPKSSHRTPTCKATRSPRR